MGHALQKSMTRDDFLAWEDAQSERHEFVGGEIYAMTGARIGHNRIVSNIVAFLLPRVRAMGCDVFFSDMMLVIENASYYPDVLVHRNNTGTRLTDSATYVKHACLLVEVTSPGTEAVDRREKRMSYRNVPDQKMYLIVYSDTRKVECHVRGTDNLWSTHILEGEAEVDVSLAVPSLHEPLKLDTIYEGTEA
jgi:Uma2 family endonuclease